MKLKVEWCDGKQGDLDGPAEALSAVQAVYPEAFIYQEGSALDRIETPEELAQALLVGDRILVWPDAETAGALGSGDDGSNAVAEIVKEG